MVANAQKGLSIALKIFSFILFCIIFILIIYNNHGEIWFKEEHKFNIPFLKLEIAISLKKVSRVNQRDTNDQ